MNKPHKHCEVIKAWADGAEIQVKDPALNRWSPLITERPYWYEDMQYRVKPKTIRYRVALINETDNRIETTTADTDEQAKRIESWTTFIKWITDWIEVEV